MKFGAWFLLWLLLAPILSAQSTLPSLVLEGTVTGAQNKTYIEVPFQVPEEVHRIRVDFSYTGREQHTTLDLGIADPYRFRGASGGNKSHFTISETDATPSYLPGEIPPLEVAPLRAQHSRRRCLALPGRDSLQPSGRGPQLCVRTAGPWSTLVSWRPAHAYRA
jgi:hypothetical protein